MRETPGVRGAGREKGGTDDCKLDDRNCSMFS